MLHIDIHSFSYLLGGIPKDPSGNGGGFAFDCRGILNPGRVEEYKKLNGSDAPVQKYLEEKTKMNDFLEGIFKVISISIDEYIRRGFGHLQINFGCTGGQHRSVYAAIKTAEFVKKKYPNVEVSLHHDEQPNLN